MHSGADTAAPAEGAVTKGTGVLTLLGEALRSELVGLGEVGVVEVDCPPLASAGEQGSKVDQRKLTAPERRDNGTPLGDEHALVNIVGGTSMRRPAQNRDRPPPERLGSDGLDVL